MHKIIAALLLAIGVALSGFFIGNAVANAKAFDRYVTVKGLAEKTVKSDQAIWKIQYSYADNSLTDLYQGMAKAKKHLIQFLEAQGFQVKNISVQPLSIVDNQSNSYSSNKDAKRYVANGGVIVSTPAVEQVSQAIQKTGQLVEQGVVVTSSSAQYRYTELNTIKPQMLVNAIQNARLAAKSFAKNSQSQLGGIRNATQGLFSIRDANDSYNSGTSIMKKVRVVINVQYFLKR